MKRLIIMALTMVFLAAAFAGCAAERKTQAELRGLMLQDNLRMGRNKAYFSKHNTRIKRDANRTYRRNSRNL